MRTAGSWRAPQDVPPVGELPWSLATSYKRCEVVFMGQGGRASAGRPGVLLKARP
jgi:hypothetical protein